MFTEKDLITFKELGFIGPIDFLSQKEVEQLKKKLLNHQRWIFESGFTLNQVLLEGAQLTYKRELIEFLNKYLFDDVVSLGSRPFSGGGDPGKIIPWHHEMDFGRIFGNKVSGVQTWLSLDEVDMNNGALQVIVKSHRISELDPLNVYGSDVYNKKENLHLYSIDFLMKKLEKHNFETFTFNAKPGQLYIFDWKLLHRTYPYQGLSKKRITINARYVAQRSDFSHEWFKKNLKFLCSKNNCYNNNLLKLKKIAYIYKKNTVRFETFLKKINKKLN